MIFSPPILLAFGRLRLVFLQIVQYLQLVSRRNRFLRERQEESYLPTSSLNPKCINKLNFKSYLNTSLLRPPSPGAAFDVPGPTLPVAVFDPLPGSMGAVAAEKRAIVKKQRECACGGRAQCEHERAEEIKSGMEGGMTRESDDLKEAKRRDRSADRKLEAVRKEKDELLVLQRAKEDLARMAREAEMEGTSLRPRGRGRGRPWIDESPERYV